MAGDKAIYAPGELDKVKRRLGPVDENEARRMQKILGGEVGSERSASDDKPRRPKPAVQTGKAKRTVETTFDDDDAKGGRNQSRASAAPLQIAPPSYFERVKQDVCCGESQFGIKTFWQVFNSRFSFFKPPRDLVSQYFVRQSLNEYYRQLESLVGTTRLLLPKTNPDRAARLKKQSKFSFAVLDTIRLWKIRQISGEIAALQRRPRAVYVRDFQPLLREVYRPLFILQELSLESDIETAFNNLYRILFIDSSAAETEKEKKKITQALAAYRYVSTNIRYLLYPLLMKNIASEYCPYDSFFSEYAETIMLFLGLTEKDKLLPPKNETAPQKNAADGSEQGEAPETLEQGRETAADDDAADEDDAAVAAKKAEEKRVEEANRKALDKGIKTLEMLFPKSGLSCFETFPDFYPYFASIFTFRRGVEMISPKDPAQLAFVLSMMIEEMIFGFRAIKFTGDVEGTINTVIDEWNYVIDEIFYDTYVRLIEEYVEMMKSQGGTGRSSYAMNTANDIQWARRYYLFPHYDYKSVLPPSFSKKDIRSMFALARRFRKALTDVAEGISTANLAGGAASNAVCQTMQNPWAKYSFEVANPVSKRLDLLLPPNQKTNVSLVFFTLAAVTLLDDFLSDENSVANSVDQSVLFRSVNNEGREAILWVDKRTDVDSIFRDSLASRKKEPGA